MSAAARVDPSQLDRLRVNFRLILKLRWLAAAGQLATIAFTQAGLGVDLPLAGLLAILAFEVLSNAVLEGWFRGAGERATAGEGRRLEHVLGSVMMLDILLLSALLFLSGGPTNPFSIFYLVNIVLSAVVLNAPWTIAISAAGLLLFGLLFLFHVPLPELERLDYAPPPPGGRATDFTGRLSLYLKGLLVAFVMAATVIAFFVSRLTSERSALEAALTEARQRKARSERLEAMATLAAGAAHELASPLSTIAVVARDLELALERQAPAGDAADDARLVRREVARCRAILDQMAADAGQSAGEEFVAASVGELVEQTLAGLRGRERVRLDCPEADAARRFTVPRRALALALRQVVKNALDASRDGDPVDVVVRAPDGGLEVEVRDRGVGMSAETVERAVDPFFTTKEPGQGMGLGLFLTRTVIERLDGRIRFESEPGQGTRAVVSLALPAAREDAS